MSPTPIELLSPARNLACGLAAIDHGADAVYIGAPRFGARASAGNSLDDLQSLIDYAHRFHARVYVTVNTILYDAELAEVERLVWDLWRIGADALIVQDMALLRLHLPPIPLHASTQMDNRTPERVQWLLDHGYSQTVLARELSLTDIRAIHEAVPAMPLEAFVHGALCVSYSGQCYASQYCFGRSANRGECAQFCRLPFSLEDGNGRILARDKHLLSLRDMNRSGSLEEMMDAGITSFKIEGRLKDAAYVKNITAYYRQEIDRILARRTDFCRSSDGEVTLSFTPDPQKSFNRGFTEYFLHGRTDDVWSFDTPKARGERMGTVVSLRRDCLTVDTDKPFHNGDGACFLDNEGRLWGFRVNRVEGNRLFITSSERLPVAGRFSGCPLWRNADIEWDRLLDRPSATRSLPIDIRLQAIPFGYALTMGGVTCSFSATLEPARTPQAENIRTQLSRLGGTEFTARNIDIDLPDNPFIPSSLLADWRRQTVAALQQQRRVVRTEERGRRTSPLQFPQGEREGRKTEDGRQPIELTWKANIANHTALAFCRAEGAVKVQPAFELQQPEHAALMTCRHCLRYAFGFCPKQDKANASLKEPLVLVSADGRRFTLRFDCRQCEMQVCV